MLLELRVLVSILAGVLCCFGQDVATLQVKVVKGVPFSATATTESAQTLGNSTRVTKSTTAQIARDSYGRTRRQQTLADGDVVLFIADPVAGFGYVVDKNKKLARKYAFLASSATDTDATAGESLGAQTLENLNVDGTRVTHTLPAGSAGNDNALEIVTEAWYSKELQTVIMRKTSDPRIGEVVYKLTNIQRGEPEAFLFEIPGGFAIREEVTVPN